MKGKSFSPIARVDGSVKASGRTSESDEVGTKVYVRSATAKEAMQLMIRLYLNFVNCKLKSNVLYREIPI